MKKSIYILLCCMSVCVFSQNEVLSPLDPKRLNIEDSYYSDCDLCPGFNYVESQGLIDESSPFTNTYLKSDDKVCRYAPSNIVDGNPATAWVEGVKGSGIGAEIIIPELLDVNSPVKIWAGYGKSEALFYANNRPKKVLVSILKAKNSGDSYDANDVIGCSQDSFGDFQTVESKAILLKDINGYQELQLPEFTIEKYLGFPAEYYDDSMKKIFWDYAYFLRLEILEIL